MLLRAGKTWWSVWKGRSGFGWRGAKWAGLDIYRTGGTYVGVYG